MILIFNESHKRAGIEKCMKSHIYNCSCHKYMHVYTRMFYEEENLLVLFTVVFLVSRTVPDI